MTNPHSHDPNGRYSRPSGVPVPTGSAGGVPLHGGLPGPGVPPPQDPGPAPGLRCRVRVGSADGVLAIVPHLLGFYPADSLVVLGIGGLATLLLTIVLATTRSVYLFHLFLL